MSDVSLENENQVKEEVITDNNSTEEKKEVITPDDYKLIRDMVKDMDEWNETLNKYAINSLHYDYGLSTDIFVTIGMISEEKIKEMTLDEIKEFFKKNADPQYVHNVPEINTLEEGIKYMLEVKEIQTNKFNTDMDAKQLKADSESITNDYLNFLSSDKVTEARHKRLLQMKEISEKETDIVKKKQMEKLIKATESMDNFDFVFDRFEKSASEKELRITFEQFFDSRRSNYIMERFQRRIAKFGFEHPIYRYFINLEENFLEEKYHPFNNLFLFYYMRYVAYADPYDKTQSGFVKVFTSTIANLIYHKFPSNDSERKFLDIVRKFDDMFMDKYDYFVENNTTHPNHPIRIERSQKAETDRKSGIIAKMDELGITGYDSNQTSDELAKYMKDELDRIIAENTKRKEKKTDGEEKDVDVSDNDTVSNDDSVVENSSEAVIMTPGVILPQLSTIPIDENDSTKLEESDETDE